MQRYDVRISINQTSVLHDEKVDAENPSEAMYQVLERFKQNPKVTEASHFLISASRIPRD